MNLKTFIRKATGRSRRLMGKLPINQMYKPRGMQRLLPSDNYKDDASIEYIQLRPPYISTLNLPDKFVSDCSWFSKPEMSVEIPGDYLAIIKDGRVYSYDASNMAIISRDNYLIEELCFQWVRTGERLAKAWENKVFTITGFQKPKKYKGTVFSLLGGGAAKYYYYHWMIDSIARLGLLKESGRFDQVDYFLVPAYTAKYHKDTLTHFGITEDKIINEEHAPHIQADYLIVTSYTQVKFHHPKWACDFLHDSFTVRKEGKKRDKLIYIPRGDAGINRRVVNEAELIPVLQSYGFDTRFLADMAITDEAEYFNSAKLVLGAQGSGFANLVFCEPGTKVVQFFPDKYVRHIDYDLANKMSLEYHYILCPSVGDAVDTVDGQKLDVIADIPAITKMIEKLLREMD